MNLAEVEAMSSSPNQKASGQGLIVHYSRLDDNYEHWGLNVWGAGYNGPQLKWEQPLPQAGTDDFGAYWKVPYAGKGKLNFVVHNPHYTKELADLHHQYPVPKENKEV